MDICLCTGEGCARKDTCWRHIAPASERQYYFMAPPLDEHGDCGYYWEVKDDTSRKS